MAATLALIAAFCFALAATLQQKGAIGLPRVSIGDPKSLVALAAQTTWLAGTAVLLCGYGFQAAALDRGRLDVIQPLLVTTIVFALPLGWWLTDQHVGVREIVGAVVIIVGLALFVVFGKASDGVDSAPNSEWLSAILVLGVLSAVLLYIGRSGSATTRAAVYGSVAGILFGLSAALTKPTIEMLHESVSAVLSHWEVYALAIAGVLGFVLQQVSLGTGKLAPSVATVSVVNPIVSILLGVVLLEERLSRPAWHVILALVGLALALGGAVAISLAGEKSAKPALDPAHSGAA